jgi:hypothetical protein
MPNRKLSLHLLFCAVLAGTGMTAFTQTSSSSSKSSSTAAATASSKKQASSKDQKAQKSDKTDEKGKESKKEQSMGKMEREALADPGVDPFPQVKPLPDGMMPGVKKGSIEDVNAVGTRCIGCRGLGNWYSVNAEIRMGASYAKQIDQTAKFVTDPVVTEYVNRIGQNIVRNSDCKVPFTIKVIDTNQINAFALPGGFFYVNSGLILAANNEAELAGVMSHETAHVCAHHAVREMTRANMAQIAMVPLMMTTGYTWTGYEIYQATNLMIPMAFLEFSRKFEAQADYLGVQYMYRAGYDPQAFVQFFEKIEDLDKQKPGAVSRLFMSHPPTPHRIMETEKEIATILPPRNEYLVNTSEFNEVKARLARIENRRRLLQHNIHRPSLRRVNDTNGHGGGEPTLHRRPDSNNN